MMKASSGNKSSAILFSAYVTDPDSEGIYPNLSEVSMTSLLATMHTIYYSIFWKTTCKGMK
ncbi:hypothetical protein H663_010115 [Limnohabitans planktonicus II-D5]|jgi:hypothetical protein|uniref:Uncharacterized protein n=1 Tax=Limnohabitans planktonicus II-D5 TaxID=1293045 RepID=A0A2T7UDS8_9BURK|nr:hypothetical protein H663_010115 [Limnohabitans planktonicus II-D5]